MEHDRKKWRAASGVDFGRTEPSCHCAAAPPLKLRGKVPCDGINYILYIFFLVLFELGSALLQNATGERSANASERRDDRRRALLPSGLAIMYADEDALYVDFLFEQPMREMFWVSRKLEACVGLKGTSLTPLPVHPYSARAAACLRPDALGILNNRKKALRLL